VTDRYPADGAINVPVDVDLSWLAGEGTGYYTVRFGDTADPVPAYIGNQPGTTYDPGTLQSNTTYYWLVIPRNSIGSGDWTTWSFTTEPEYVDVVDFDRTGVSTNDGSRSPDTDTLFGDTWTFSDTVPMVSSTDGSNATIYGGAITTWSESQDYTPIHRFLNSRLQLFVIPSDPNPKTIDTSAEGMLVWTKADFLNGTNAQTVSLNAGDMLSCNIDGVTGNNEFRFVVKEAGVYYVSEATTSGNGAYSIDPTTTNWATINTSTYAIDSSFVSQSFTDVQAAGLYFFSERADNNTNIKIDRFELKVEAGSLF